MLASTYYESKWRIQPVRDLRFSTRANVLMTATRDAMSRLAESSY